MATLPKGKGRLEIYPDDELLHLIHSWRRQQEDIPGKAEAARRLVVAGLLAEGQPGAKRYAKEHGWEVKE